MNLFSFVHRQHIMTSSTKPSAPTYVLSRKSQIQIALSLVPLTDAAIAEFKASREKRDTYVVELKKLEEKAKQLKIELEAETDRDKKKSISEQIRKNASAFHWNNVWAQVEEANYGMLLWKYQQDFRLYYLAKRNKWPEVRVHLPSPDEIEAMRQRRVKLAQQAANSSDDLKDDTKGDIND